MFVREAVMAEESQTAVLPKLGSHELTPPILTSLPDWAPSDSTVPINDIFLPETKIFQIFKIPRELQNLLSGGSCMRIWSSHCWVGNRPLWGLWVLAASQVSLLRATFSLYISNIFMWLRVLSKVAPRAPLRKDVQVGLSMNVSMGHPVGQCPLGKVFGDTHWKKRYHFTAVPGILCSIMYILFLTLKPKAWRLLALFLWQQGSNGALYTLALCSKYCF